MRYHDTVETSRSDSCNVHTQASRRWTVDCLLSSQGKFESFREDGLTPAPNGARVIDVPRKPQAESVRETELVTLDVADYQCPGLKSRIIPLTQGWCDEWRKSHILKQYLNCRLYLEGTSLSIGRDFCGLSEQIPHLAGVTQW